MKKICLSLMFFSSVSFAQSTVKLDLLCFSLEVLTKELSKYEEFPLLVANSVREEKGKPSNHSMILLANPETRSWTLVEKTKDENYCVLAIGNQLSPVIKGKAL
jgi:hypothetical protein